MAKASEVYIQMVVDRIAPDRTQYKMYSPSLIPQRTLVSVPVDAENVTVIYQKDVEGKDTEQIDYVVLTLDGLMQVTGRIADSVDKLHGKYLEDLRKGVR